MVKPGHDYHSERLKKSLLEMKKVAIAFSGGIDSAFLLKKALDILGREKVLAITADSKVITGPDREYSVKFAKIFGANRIFVKARLLEIDEFIKNPANRCYICKKYIFGEIMDIARENNFSHLLDGQNLDDTKDYRPGALAAKELGVKSPLKDAGFTKAMIRNSAKKLKIPQWDRPSDSCLATRIPYGQKITEKKLERIAKAEDFLRSMGFSSSLRVRHDGNTARMEIDQAGFEMAVRPDIRSAVIKYFKNIGFKFIALDLEGYRMGSLGKI